MNLGIGREFLKMLEILYVSVGGGGNYPINPPAGSAPVELEYTQEFSIDSQ